MPDNGSGVLREWQRRERQQVIEIFNPDKELVLMDTVSLTIDGLSIEAAKGKTILEAALDNDIYIPHLCHHPDLVPTGVCRLCMVDIEGMGMVISCKTPVEDNLGIWTESPEVDKVRRVAV